MGGNIETFIQLLTRKGQRCGIDSDGLHERGIRFALSNVLRSKGKENKILLQWIKTNAAKYRIIYLDYNYSNSNYQTKDKTASAEEVLVVNY